MNQEDVVKAIVDMDTPDGGRGVLIPGGYIVTAAHCIPPPHGDADKERYAPLESGDYLIPIKTICGDLITTPYIVERIQDIAILGAPDNQEYYNEAEKYEEFCEQVAPVQLWLEDPEIFEPFPVYAFNLDRKWLKGEAQQCNENAPNLVVTFPRQIEPGASGGPIITESSKLAGVISMASVIQTKSDKCTGTNPRPHMTLPAWILYRIME